VSALRIVRLVTWTLVLALTLATGLVLWRGDGGPAATEEVAIGGPFSLVDTEGQRVTEAALQGRAHALFFGFTHCPEVCPTTLAELSVMIDELGADGEKLDVYFVTVDPERDDRMTLKNYLSSFGQRIRGLTGSEDEVATIATAYRVYRRKVPTENGDYTMDHTAAVFLFDPDGRFKGTIGYGEKHDDALAKLKRLVSA
jgi:protein SCO1/2